MIYTLSKSRIYRVRLALLFIAVFAIFLFIVSVNKALAAPQDITMTPTTASPVVNPGSEYKGSFQVINQGKSGYKFLVYATPYRVSGEDYNPEFTVLPSAPNISSWLNFSSPGGYINPGQTATIHYTISVPENTQPGGYYAAAFAETQFPKVGNSITLNERVGELFYIQVAGPVAKKGELITWQSNFLQKPPLTSTIRIKDDGNIHFPADIHYNIQDIFGNNKYSLHTVKELLPQTIRRITIPWTKTPSFGLFKVNGTVSFLGQTHNLPTHWILVMSNTVRLTVLIIVIILVLVIIFGPKLFSGKKHKSHRRK